MSNDCTLMGSLRVSKALNLDDLSRKIHKEAEAHGADWDLAGIEALLQGNPFERENFIFLNRSIGELEICIDVRSSVHAECPEAEALSKALSDVVLEPGCLTLTEHELGTYGDPDSTRIYPVAASEADQRAARFLHGIQMINDILDGVPPAAMDQIKQILIEASKETPAEGCRKIRRFSSNTILSNYQQILVH